MIAECHIDGRVWHLNIWGEMAEMSSKVSAYNGEPLTAVLAEHRAEGDTVGSLTGTQRSIIVGSLLGDGAMRCKANYRSSITSSLYDPVTTEAERPR